MTIDKRFKMAVGCVRVSTSEQEISVEAQKETIRRWCDEQGLTLLEIFADVGVSGSARITERPGLLSALSKLDRKTCLVTVRFDRIARSSLTHALVLQEVENAKSGLFSCTETNCQSAEAALLRNVLRAVSELERALIRDRVASALLHVRRTGRKFNKSKMGFEYDAQGNAIENPEEQETLRLMATWRSQGKTYTAISERLNDLGRQTKTGKAWSPQGVRIVFLNHQRHVKLVA